MKSNSIGKDIFEITYIWSAHEIGKTARNNLIFSINKFQIFE